MAVTQDLLSRMPLFFIKKTSYIFLEQAIMKCFGFIDDLTVHGELSPI